MKFTSSRSHFIFLWLIWWCLQNTLQLNVAACYQKMDEHRKSIETCNKVRTLHIFKVPWMYCQTNTNKESSLLFSTSVVAFQIDFWSFVMRHLKPKELYTDSFLPFWLAFYWVKVVRNHGVCYINLKTDCTNQTLEIWLVSATLFLGCIYWTDQHHESSRKLKKMDSLIWVLHDEGLVIHPLVLTLYAELLNEGCA